MQIHEVEILQNISAQLSPGFQKHSSLGFGSVRPLTSVEEKREILHSSHEHLVDAPRLTSPHSEAVLFLFQ